VLLLLPLLFSLRRTTRINLYCRAIATMNRSSAPCGRRPACCVDFDLHPFDFAVELVAAWAVVFRDGFAHVTPDLRRLVQPEGKEMCALDAPFSKLLAIEKQRDVRSLAETATAQVGSR
jgi:hypothetical protein